MAQETPNGPLMFAINGSRMAENPSSERREWWRKAVVYQVYVRSFADSNGDGIGDLPGITARLEYLQQLGVQAIWLTPCFPSPQRDHGYDVADYFGIEPDYGTIDDFDRLVEEARLHGVKVLMDVVPTHCSVDHPWFQAALAAGPGSPERARFYFRDGRGANGSEPPNDWLAVFGGRSWTRITEPDGTPGQWYLHMFTPWQPDFDWTNSDVIEHFDDMLRFWFDRGVEGFRVDAVTVTGKEPGLPDAGLPSPEKAHRGAWHKNPHVLFHPSAHAVWRHWRQVIDRYQRQHPGRQLMTVSEAYTDHRPELLAEYVGGQQFHQSFAFDLMLSAWHAPSYRDVIDRIIVSLDAVGATPTWTLNNHDTQRSVTRLGRSNATDPDSMTGDNLRYIDAPVDLQLGSQRARAAVGLVAALPGSMYLYQGEELGLPEVLDLPAEARQDPIFARTNGAEIGRDGCRIPLPWTSDVDTYCGFSTVGPTSPPWLPQPEWWSQFGADVQADDPQSMLWWYRTVFSARRQLEGPLEWVDGLPDDQVVAFRRGECLVVANFGDDPVVLPPTVVGKRRVLVSSAVIQHGIHRLPGNTCAWLREV
jgi:alpha-glucosidase